MKVLEGKVLSTKMQDTAVVAVVRRVVHPLYKKVFTRHKKYKVDTKGVTVTVGDSVKFIETRPTSSQKRFKLQQEKGGKHGSA